MPFKYASPIERILANSVTDESHQFEGSYCWLWLRAYKVTRRGLRYPTLSVRVRGKVRKLTAHRFIIRYIHRRRLSKRQVGLHMCGNHTCVNPAHIAGGTQRQNVRQCVLMGRHRNGYGRTRAILTM